MAMTDNTGAKVQLSAAQMDWLLVSAHTLIEQHRQDEALTVLEFLQLFEPNNENCLKLLARAYCEAGRRKEAQACLQQVQALPLTEAELTAFDLLRSRIAGGQQQKAKAGG